MLRRVAKVFRRQNKQKSLFPLLNNPFATLIPAKQLAPSPASAARKWRNENCNSDTPACKREYVGRCRALKRFGTWTFNNLRIVSGRRCANLRFLRKTFSKHPKYAFRCNRIKKGMLFRLGFSPRFVLLLVHSQQFLIY